MSSEAEELRREVPGDELELHRLETARQGVDKSRNGIEPRRMEPPCKGIARTTRDTTRMRPDSTRSATEWLRLETMREGIELNRCELIWNSSAEHR